MNCVGTEGGDHYNAMVHPFTVGPMALSGFAWYQGENGAGSIITGCETWPNDPNPVFNNNTNLIMCESPCSSKPHVQLVCPSGIMTCITADILCMHPAWGSSAF
jgi:hypothetical protein